MDKFLKVIFVISMCAILPITAKAAFTGGGSDGGGNTYRGKPLESYAKNPVTLPAFQKLLAPLLQDIESKESSANRLRILQNMITSVFSQKIWYFVPGPLDQIPADLLNSAIRTDQAALQGFDRVWIDEDIWNSMGADDQAKLLLHEAFMGLKILQFASPFRLCQAAYGTTYNCSREGRIDASLGLTSKDYVNVQSMTIQVSSGYPTMSAEDWMKMIQQNRLKYPYDWFEAEVPITPEELSQRLFQSSVSGFLPTQGYNLRNFDTTSQPPMNSQQELYEYFQKNKETCQVQAQVTGNSLHLKLTSKSETFDQVIPLPAKMVSSYDDLFHENRELQRIGIPYYTGQARPNGGFTMYNMWLGLDSYNLSQVYIQEMVCMDKDCSTPYIDVKGGMIYICSDNGYLFKP